MADIKQMRIFCAEQIEVPPELPDILKNYSKAVIRNNPGSADDIVAFSRKYFEDILEERNKSKAESDQKIDTIGKKSQ